MCSRDDVFHCLSHSLLWLQLNTPTQWHARTIPNDTHTHWEYTDTILYVLLYSCTSMYLHLYFVDVLFVLSVCVRWILCNVFRFRFSSFSLYRIIISSSYFFSAKYFSFAWFSVYLFIFLLFYQMIIFQFVFVIQSLSHFARYKLQNFVFFSWQIAILWHKRNRSKQTYYAHTLSVLHKHTRGTG